MIMKLTYKPSGVCCKQIDVEVEDGILTNVEFTGGCQGNLAAIKLLVEGMKIEDIIEKLQNVTCGDKPTSCTMQLCNALKFMLDENK